MTYEQIVSKVKAKYADADASSLSGTVAIQINLTGKCGRYFLHRSKRRQG